MMVRVVAVLAGCLAGARARTQRQAATLRTEKRALQGSRNRKEDANRLGTDSWQNLCPKEPEAPRASFYREGYLVG